MRASRRWARSVKFAFCLAAGFAVGLLGYSPDARAARPGRVEIEGAEVFEGPSRTYPVLEKLERGSSVATSNFPTEGFHKVRTSSGVVGWVAVEAIVFEDHSAQVEPTSLMQPPVNTQSSADTSNPWRGKAPTAVAQDFRTKRHSSFIRLRAFGGMNFFYLSDINSHLSFQRGGLRNGYNYGGEICFRFTRDLAMVMRGEVIEKTVAGAAQAQNAGSLVSNVAYEITTGAIPIMAGLEMTLADESDYSAHFGILGGIGLNTYLYATAITLSEPNVTKFISQNFAGLGRLIFAYHANKTTHVFAEAGYRFLRSQSQVPVLEGAGVEIWQSGGVTQPRVIDLSGAIANFGIAFHF